MQHTQISAFRPTRCTRWLLSLAALLTLSACDTEYMYETITGERPDQVVDGPRRVPALNANPGGLPPQSQAQPKVQPQAQSSNPYDSYDASGNQVTPQDANAAPSWWDRTFSSEAPPAPPPPAVMADAVRKPLPGNPYVSTETSSIAPSPAAPETMNYPKLSSVPPRPEALDEVKKTREHTLGMLETDHAIAQQDRGYLDRDIGSSNAGTQMGAPAAMAAPPPPAITPLVAMAPPPPPAPMPVASLPPVTVAVAPPPPVVVYVPPAPEPAPAAIAPAPAPVTMADAPLPSPEMIKVMRPSRYERLRESQSNPNY